MNKSPLFLLLLIVFCSPIPLQAQYTETINTNRPGSSQGAFSVGRGIYQFELGANYGKDRFRYEDSPEYNSDYEMMRGTYEVRFGLFWEELEINLSGDFLNAEHSYMIGSEEQSTTMRNFGANVLGAKVLVFDPYKRHFFDKPNLYSWKANQRFKWWKLLPAISVYAGANLTFWDRPASYPFFGEERGDISPKAALITQHNWGGTVFVMNFIGDRLTDDHKQFAAIFTLTQNFGGRFSIFGEFQTINDDFYSDDLVRFGTAYLITPNWQIDLSGMVNFKDTPQRWEAGIGLSYRLDRHSKERVLEDPNEKRKQRYNF